MLDGVFVRSVTDTIIVDVDESLYSLDSLFRTCYVFTDRAYVYLRREKPGHVSVHIAPKERTIDLAALAGEFTNELLDYQVRSLVSAESGKIRELIVAQAFAESNLLDETSDDDGQSDPLEISNYHEHKKQ